jgi:hypothetical protein
MVERIDSVFDVAAIQKEVDGVKTGLSASQKALVETYDLINKLKGSNIGSLAENASKLETAMNGVDAEQKKVKKSVTELTLAAQEYKKTVDQTATIQAKMNVGTSEAAKQNVAAKVSLQQLNQATKEEIQLAQAAEGSIKQKQIQLKQLQRTYDELSGSQRSAGNGQQLLQQIQSLDAELKELEGTTGRFQRNVGNYANAFKGALKTLEDELTSVKNQLNDPSIGGKQLESLRQQEHLLSEVLDGVKVNFTSTRQEAKAFQEAATKIGLTLGQQSEAFQHFRSEVGKGVDDIKDIKDSVKLAASDTQGFDRLIGAAQGLTGAFSVAQGAAALLGSEDEDLQKTFVKLQAAMTILNGLQAVQNELKNKDSIFRKAANYLTALGTKYTQADTVAKEANAAATNVATKATKGFGTALKGIGIGLLLMLIPVLVSAMDGMDSVFKSSADNANRLRDASNDLNDEYKETVKNVAEVQVKLEIMTDRVKKGGLSFGEKKKFVKEYNKEFGDTLGVAKNYNEAEKNLIEKSGTFIQALYLRAQAQAALNLAMREQEKIFDEQITSQQEINNITTHFNQAIIEGTITKERAAKEIKGYRDRRSARRDEEQKDANFRKGFFKQQFDDLSKQADSLEKAGKFFTNSDDGKDHQKEIEEAQKRAAELRKLREDNNRLELAAREKLKELELKINADKNKAISEDENVYLQKRLEALGKYNDYSAQLINAQKEFEIHNLEDAAIRQKEELLKHKLSQAERLEVIKSVATQRQAIEGDAAVKIDTINAEVAAKTVTLIDNLNAKRIESMNVALASFRTIADYQQDNINKQIAGVDQLANAEEDKYAEIYAADVEALNNAYLNKQISQEQYLAKRDQLEENFNKKAVKREITHVKNLLKISNLSAEQKKAYYDQLFKLEQDLNAANEKGVQKLLARLEKIGQISSNIMASIQAVTDISYEKQKTQIEETENTQQKNYENEVKRIGDSSLTEEQKANKLKILESQRLAQKEQNERKQRQLEAQRARFQKAADITNIITETALAVIRALGDKTTPGFLRIPLAITIGALGAAQLAKAISSPLPKYADGTEDHPGGPFIWGEEGRELAITPDGRMQMSPDQATLGIAPKGTRIIPHDEVNELMRLAMMRMTAEKLGAVNGYKTDSAVEKKLDKLDNTMQWVGLIFQKGLSKQKAPRVIVNQTTAWNGYAKTKYVN